MILLAGKEGLEGCNLFGMDLGVGESTVEVHLWVQITRWVLPHLQI
jgi:hypothetical protein